MRILTIVGARPQFIKAATVSRAIRAAGSDEVLVHTGQHFDANMSDVFFTELEIPNPDHHLGIGGGSHGDMTGRMLQAIEAVIIAENPEHVLVYGDTNSTLAGALAAAKLNVPVAHVEAGLRSYNRRMPEEVNRVVADHVATWLLTPTDVATQNLIREGIVRDRIHQVGDVMYDAAIYYGKKAERTSTILDDLNLHRGEFVLATIHRQENTDDAERLGAICLALSSVAAELKVILPLHPRTRQRLASAGKRLDDRIKVLEPLGYLDMLMLERTAAVVATDSGGVQKEAYFHGVPCVTLRDETEWVELVELGWNRLAPPGKTDIAAAIRSAIGTKGKAESPYGGGDAAERVVRSLG